jgi:hypothetical protein
LKFSQVVAGKRSERPVEFMHRGVVHKTALRPLDGMEESLALSRATEYAQGQKALSATPGNALFDLGYMAHCLALACVDTDSPVDARTPYFDNVDQVLGLDGELIIYLNTLREVWQQECSPTRATLPAGELISTLVRIVEQDDPDFFIGLRPGTQWTLLRSTASLLLDLPEGRSRLSSLFAPTSAQTPTVNQPS